MMNLPTNPPTQPHGATSAEALSVRLNALRAALDECSQEVPAALALPARRSLFSVEKRLALGVDHTVAALFGGTGSGKSSLFNALTELQFADVGARRPMTSRAAACSWGDDAQALLDFLGVDADRRIRRDSLLDGGKQDDLAGLVLLDVPDYDSVTTAHALQVDRLVPLADVLIWVLDPQKYADAALHDGYLRKLGARQEDMLVLVNQIDTVTPASQKQLLSDVKALLKTDGLQDVRVLPVCALQGQGLAAVRQILLERVQQPSNAARTAQAQLDQIAQRLAVTVGAHSFTVPPAANTELIDALVKASGCAVVAESIQENLKKVFPTALVRPQPPANGIVASACARWLKRVTNKMPSVWVHAVQANVVAADVLSTQTTEALASVRLPAVHSAAIDFFYWGGALFLLLGLVWAGANFAAGRAGIWAFLLMILGCILLFCARYCRRRRAQKQADIYLQTVQTRVETLVLRGLAQPAAQVLARHERLYQALQY